MKIDKNILAQLSSTYGVIAVESSPQVKAIIKSKKTIEGNSLSESILTEGGYSWDAIEKCYKNNQHRIYFIPNYENISLWTYENILFRSFDSIETLSKWINGNDKYPEGKVNTFIKIYSNLVDQANQGAANIPIKHVGQPERPSDNPPMSKVDTIIQQATKKAGSLKKMAADDIIDLWNQSKELEKTNPEDGAKLLAFIKTLKPLEEGKISRSMLEEVIRHVVKAIIKEIHKKEVDEMTGTNAAGPTSEPLGVSKKKVMEKSFQKSFGYTGKIYKDIQGGEVVYWMDNGDTGGKIRIKPESVQKFINQGYRLIDMTVAENAGALEESDEADAVNDMWNGSDDELDYYNKELTKKVIPAKKKTPQIPKVKKSKTFVNGKEIPIKEMTVTGGGEAYNIPGAFSTRGGSRKGLKSSEELGFTLTPQGKEEMGREMDKLK